MLAAALRLVETNSPAGTDLLNIYYNNMASLYGELEAMYAAHGAAALCWPMAAAVIAAARAAQPLAGDEDDEVTPKQRVDAALSEVTAVSQLEKLLPFHVFLQHWERA